MSLPKIVVPTYELILPSKKEKIQFRPFLVKEEKILLMAAESKDSSEMIRAMRQIIKNCLLNEKLDIDKLPLFDLEYIFLQLRSKSVGEVLETRFVCKNIVDAKECGNSEKVLIPLDKVQVEFPKQDYSLIKLSATMALKLKYPTFEILELLAKSTGNKYDDIFASIGQCIDCVVDGEEVYTTFTDEELNEFLESMPKNKFELIEKFLDNLPKIKIEIPFLCRKCGYKETLVLEDLQSFFD